MDMLQISLANSNYFLLLLQLQLQYAPVLLFYPATSGPHASPSAEPVTYDFNRMGFEGSEVAAELSKQLGIKVPYSEPFAWKFAATIALATIFFSSLLFFLVPKLSAANSWGLGTIWSILFQAAILITILIMCAGHMWNSIRHAPYMSMSPKGQPEYFASGFQNQYGAETQIVAVICECVCKGSQTRNNDERLTTKRPKNPLQTLSLRFQLSRLPSLCPCNETPSSNVLASISGLPFFWPLSAFCSKSFPSRQIRILSAFSSRSLAKTGHERGVEQLVL